MNVSKVGFSLRSNRQTGLTLIELLIVVAIVGILSQVAVPNYTNFIVEHRRADAHHLLQANAQLLQRCLTLAGSYRGSSNVDGSYNDDCNVVTVSRDGHYDLTSTLTAQTWSLVATAAIGGKQQRDADCATFVLDHTGRKTATGNNSGDCW